MSAGELVTRKMLCQLSSDDQLLIDAALKVRLMAQAPYSNYLVGAAVLNDRGAIYSGCNVERCSYSQTTHAEQNAIDSMIAQCGSVAIKAIVAVAADRDVVINKEVLLAQKKAPEGVPHFYCGHCRQIIWENCNGDTGVRCLLVDQTGVFITTIGSLLPYAFGPQDLGIHY